MNPLGPDLSKKPPHQVFHLQIPPLRNNNPHPMPYTASPDPVTTRATSESPHSFTPYDTTLVEPPLHPILFKWDESMRRDTKRRKGRKDPVLSKSTLLSQSPITPKPSTLSILPNEILWHIYIYLTGPFLSKLAILNKSHHHVIHYSNHYPIDVTSEAHAFWLYLVQAHYESQLQRRALFPCEIHPRVLYTFQWAKENEHRIALLNRACSQLEARFRLELREKVADVCLFVPTLFWYMRQSYKFEKYFQSREDMKEHALYEYYEMGGGDARRMTAEQDESKEKTTVEQEEASSVQDDSAPAAVVDASKKYYYLQGQYLNFNLAPMTLLIIPKLVTQQDGSKGTTQARSLLQTNDALIARTKLYDIARAWLHEWTSSQYVVQQDMNALLERLLHKKVRPKVLYETDFNLINGMRKANGFLDRSKIYVMHAQQRLA